MAEVVFGPYGVGAEWKNPFLFDGTVMESVRQGGSKLPPCIVGRGAVI